jgi:hypothetical protein
VVTVMESLLPPFLSSDNASREGTNAQQSMPSSYMGQLEAVLALIEQVPEQPITLDGPEYTNLTASIAAVRITLKKWVANDRRSLSPIPGLSSLNPIILIHHALARSPDQFPSPSTAELSFLQPDDLRENLRIDISAANSALANNEWKAATVLAGSVVEALLLWALQQQDPSKRESAIMKASGKTLRQSPMQTSNGGIFMSLSRSPLRELSSALILLPRPGLRRISGT